MDSLNLDTLAVAAEDGSYDSPGVTSPVTLSESLSPAYLHSGYSTGSEAIESSISETPNIGFDLNLKSISHLHLVDKVKEKILAISVKRNKGLSHWI